MLYIFCQFKVHIEILSAILDTLVSPPQTSLTFLSFAFLSESSCQAKRVLRDREIWWHQFTKPHNALLFGALCRTGYLAPSSDGPSGAFQAAVPSPGGQGLPSEITGLTTADPPLLWASPSIIALDLPRQAQTNPITRDSAMPTPDSETKATTCVHSSAQRKPAYSGGKRGRESRGIILYFLLIAKRFIYLML